MALKVKAVERLQNIGKYADTYRFVMQPELYIALNPDKVIREAALRSGISRGVMQACWDAAGEVIKAWATEGHSVALPGLGTMRFGLNAKSVADVNDVKANLISTRRIIFTPTVELKQELARTAVQITCYDRNGKELKRVLSSDPGTVEEPEGDNPNGGNSGGSSNSGGNNGGNSSTGSETVSAPTISGTTPFAESTQVTMSGPEDARVYYTTDGSTPTAESTLYTVPFTLTATTTVKAIAIKDESSSSVTTKTFTKSNGGSGGNGGDDPFAG